MKESILKISNLPSYFYLVIINMFSLIIILPFWIDNNLLVWDFPGHISAINYLDNHIWPDISGWNNSAGLGFAQGTFYPSLIHYLIATLNFIYNNTEFWIKFFYTITILSLPYSIYFFYSNIIKTKNKHFILSASLLTLIVIILGPAAYGGTLRSFTQVGLLNNFFILPIFILFLGNIFKTEKRVLVKSLTLSILLTVLVLSHFIAGFIGAVILLVLLLNKYIYIFRKTGFRDLKKYFYNPYFLPLAFSTLQISFFLLPYIIFRNNTLSQTSLVSDFAISFIVFIIGILSIFFIQNGQKFETLKRLSLVIAIFTFFAFLGLFENLLVRFGQGNFLESLHVYRLVAMSLIFLSGIFLISLLIWLSDKIFWKKFLSFSNFLPLILIFFLFVASFISIPFTRSYGKIDFVEKNLELNNEGYYLSLVTTKENFFLYRAANYPVREVNNPPKFFDLLFAESSYLESYGSALKKSLYGSSNEVDNPSWPSDYILSERNTLKLLSIFDINYLVYSDPSKLRIDICEKEFDFAELNLRGAEVDLKACRIKESLLPKSFNLSLWGNWQNNSKNAFHEDNNNIYSTFPGVSSGLSEATLVNDDQLKWGENNQQFQVDVPDSQFTILPVQYNPNWKAYKVDGNKEINIYRVTPNLVGVEESGEIRFEYFEPIWVNALKLISVTLIMINLILLILLIRKKNAISFY